MASAQIIPSSSEFACDNIARRVVRNAGKETQAQAISAFVNPFLKPTVMTLASKGRFQRGVLEKQVANLSRKLEECSATFAVEANGFRSSKLSSRESFRVVFKMPNSYNEEWMGYVATEMTLTRREINVFTTPCDVLIHRHAFSRYMQRESKHPEEILPHLSPALNLLTALAWRVLIQQPADANIAVPLDDGMLLGRVQLCRGGSERTVFHIGRKGAEQRDEPRQKGMEHTPEIEMMTYVDNNSLSDVRMDLRNLMGILMDKHAVALKAMADSTYYTSLAMPGAIRAEVEDRIGAAKKALDGLLKSYEWKTFAQNAR